MNPDIVLPTNDWIFKLLFGDTRHTHLLSALLKAYLVLPEEEYETMSLLDTYLKPEAEGDKIAILDVKVKTKTRRINLEIQVKRFKALGKRIAFYQSKMITEQVGKGEQYNRIEGVISLIIVDYELFEGEWGYVNRFRYYNPENGLCFWEVPEEICIVEIPKVPKKNDGTRGWKWTQFFKARTEEEFEMIAKTDREIREAVDLLYELSADEVVRAEYDRQQKAMMDHLTLMEDSYLDGKEAGIAIGEAKGMQKKQMEMLETMNQAESLEDFMRLREQLRTTLGNTQSIQP